MAFARRIFLFLAINALVVITLSLILSIFHIQPFLNKYGLDIPSLAIFCLIWGMGGAFISLLLSRQMAKWMLRIHLIDPRTTRSEEKTLLQTVYRLAQDAHLPEMPQVGIYESSEPNAFATGPSKRKSLVALSSGLLKRMTPQEIEGVIAHEISHIANGDMVTMTLLQGIVNAFVMFLARILAYACSGLGKSRENNSSGGSYFSYVLFVLFFEVVFMVLGSIVIAYFSRLREFRADRGGADLAGKNKMIAALESLKKMQNMRDPQMQQTSLQAFKISTPEKSRWLHLFATHPP
ncbi:MAG: protease HtpX, partial [Chlamydiales bacterium]|nr:protease HtpX [Chlamydiales bacterium]